MAIIEVNHRTLRQVARDIETYCTTQESQMVIANSAVSSVLMSNWQGQDALEFRNKWSEVNVTGSVAATMRESLRSYAEGLIACADDYERTQAEVFNAASRLMNFIGG